MDDSPLKRYSDETARNRAIAGALLQPAQPHWLDKLKLSSPLAALLGREPVPLSTGLLDLPAAASRMGDALSGKEPLTTDDAMGIAGPLSGLAMLGGLASPARPANSLGMAKRYQIDYFGEPVRILENPSKAETAAFLARTKYRAARRLVDADGNTFLWDAADPALHDHMAKNLGLGRVVSADTIGLE